MFHEIQTAVFTVRRRVLSSHVVFLLSNMRLDSMQMALILRIVVLLHIAKRFLLLHAFPQTFLPFIEAIWR